MCTKTESWLQQVAWHQNGSLVRDTQWIWCPCTKSLPVSRRKKIHKEIITLCKNATMCLFYCREIWRLACREVKTHGRNDIFICFRLWSRCVDGNHVCSDNRSMAVIVVHCWRCSYLRSILFSHTSNIFLKWDFYSEVWLQITLLQ